MNDPLRGIRIRVISMGCRTNLFESEALCSSFDAAGSILASEGVLDAVVVIGCSVTAEADRKCRQLLRRMRRENPGAVVIAAGCWAQKASPREAVSLGVDCLVGNRLKHRIPGIVREMIHSGGMLPEPRIERVDVSGNTEWDPLFLSRPQTRTRAFIKIQDGCDHRCSYCIISYLRGKGVERDPYEILGEVERVSLSGCREVVFTGINLGMYGTSSGMSLGDLVRRAGEIRGVERIRFGSIEPFALNEELLRSLSATPQFCPHLHLPLQSGDKDVLRLMRRGYSPEDFAGHADQARKYFGEELHISTDIIAGFPGESDEAFASTLSLISRTGIGRLHVFPFSPREGTSAALLPNRLPRNVVRSRVEEALSLGKALLDAYSRIWVGRNVEILVEKNDNGKIEGLSSHFIRVESSGRSEPGGLCSVVPEYASDGVLKSSVCYNSLPGIIAHIL